MSKNMQFGAAANIHMAKKKDEILIACNVNLYDLCNRLLT